MIPPPPLMFFGLDDPVVRLRTEVWRAPGLEIRVDVFSDGRRELREEDGTKLCLWVTLSNCAPSEYVRVGAFLAGEEKGEIEWPMPEK